MGICLAHVVRDIPDCRGGDEGCEWNARKGWRKGGLTEHNFTHALPFLFDDRVFHKRGWIGWRLDPSNRP